MKNTSVISAYVTNASANNTSANSTSAYNTSADEDIFPFLLTQQNFAICLWVLVAISLVAFIYGVISWCLINKFRHFKNYVFLNVIVANFLHLLFFVIYVSNSEKEQITLFLPLLLFYICLLSYNCWLIVLSHIFYSDFANVFSFNISKVFLKSSLFGWCLPFFVVFITPIILNIFQMCNLIGDSVELFRIFFFVIHSMSPIANFVIYLSVLYFVFRRSDTDANTSNKWRRVFIATLIFVFINMSSLSYLLELMNDGIIFDSISFLGDILNTIVFSLYIIAVKNNRELWAEYFNSI